MYVANESQFRRMHHAYLPLVVAAPRAALVRGISPTPCVWPPSVVKNRLPILEKLVTLAGIPFCLPVLRCLMDRGAWQSNWTGRLYSSLPKKQMRGIEHVVLLDIGWVYEGLWKGRETKCRFVV